MIPDIVAAVEKTKEAKIKRFRYDSNRASGIGYAVPELNGCLRRGVYDRTHWEQKDMHDVGAQCIFDEGNEQEKIVLRMLDDAGIKVINQQQAFTIYDKRPGKNNQILLTGTIEGKIVCSEEAGHATETVTFEIKSMDPNIYRQMNEFEDFRLKPWTSAYMAQIMAYMLGEGEDRGVFILKDKSKGTIKQVDVPLDFQMAETVLKAAEAINDHVDAGTLPDRRDDVDKCGYCPHKKYCLPDIDFDKGPAVADDPQLKIKIDRYMELLESKKEADELYKKSIAPKMKVTAAGGSLNMILGPYYLSGKTDARGTFRPKIIKLEE